MDERSRFSVCKWYADLIDDNTGDVTIVYLGELRWRFRQSELHQHSAIHRQTTPDLALIVFTARTTSLRW